MCMEGLWEAISGFLVAESILRYLYGNLRKLPWLYLYIHRERRVIINLRKKTSVWNASSPKNSWVMKIGTVASVRVDAE